MREIPPSPSGALPGLVAAALGRLIETALDGS
jgi:hypothetical protein